VRATRGVAYAAAEGAKLDAYAPLGADGEAPVIVFAPSRPLSGPQRHLFRFVGQTLASCGFVTVIPDCRSDPNAGFAEFVQDLAMAAAWARDNAVRYGADPDRMFLAGHAAGAHGMAMLALDPRWLEAVGMAPAGLRGVIGVSGLYDIPSPADLHPAGHAHPSAPPMLLIAGQQDRIDPDNTSRLARALRTVGAPVAEIRYPRLSERTGLGASLGRRGTALDEVERFVRLHSLGPGR
jgi:acetyl esterase/lipase